MKNPPPVLSEASHEEIILYVPRCQERIAHCLLLSGALETLVASIEPVLLEYSHQGERDNFVVGLRYVETAVVQRLMSLARHTVDMVDWYHAACTRIGYPEEEFPEWEDWLVKFRDWLSATE